MQSTTIQRNHADPELVVIFINRVPYDILPGHHAVTALKDWGEIPAADELEQIVKDGLEPLPNDGTVEIKGNEKFVSHPPHGGSS